MKFIRYQAQSGDIRFGCLENDQVKTVDGDLYATYTIGDVIGSLEDVQLLAPCAPTKVVAFAANYQGATGVTEEMAEPITFVKPAASVIAPNDLIVSPFKNQRVWGEAELAIVIGKKVEKFQRQRRSLQYWGIHVRMTLRLKILKGAIII